MPLWEQDYRVIQPGPVITRRTRDPRAPPVVSNFSICSCTYTCVRARANMDGVGPCFARFTAAETDFSVFLHGRGGGCATFSTGTIVNPSIDSSFFPSPPLVVRPNDFSSYLFSQNDGKRAFENFLANRLVNLGLDLSIKFSFY